MSTRNPAPVSDAYAANGALTATRSKPGDRILLIDPSQKGGLPFYTAMIAEALTEVGMRPAVLAHRLLAKSDHAVAWPVYRWLPATRWPRPVGAPPASSREQAITWLGCAVTAIFAALLLRPRIIHCEFPIHPRLDALLLKGLSWFAPVVVTAHDVVPHDPGTNAAQRVRNMYRAANIVLVHSSPAAREIENIADVRPIVVGRPALQPASMPDRASARRRLGLDPHVRIAAAVGFIRAYKGLGLLADVWEQLGNDAPLLLVLGDLVDQSESGHIDRMKVLPKADVRLGYASDEDVMAACAAADVVLLPHEWGSDSGILDLAIAAGTPVLASELRQLASLVIGSSAGRVLPREPRLWMEAVCGPLPPPPPPPPSMSITGQAHQAAYRQARASWRQREKVT